MPCSLSGMLLHSEAHVLKNSKKENKMQVAALKEPGGCLMLSSAELKEVSFAFRLCNLIWGTRAQIFRDGAPRFLVSLVKRSHLHGELTTLMRSTDL